MPYKTILVHLDEFQENDQRVQIAANIANAENGHLVGLVAIGQSNFLKVSAEAQVTAQTINLPANIVLERFESAVRRFGVASFETRLIDGEAATGLSAHGPCCDLMILGKGGTAEADSRPAASVDVLQYVVMNGGCPVLIVPGAGPSRIPGRRALVAWNGSAHAARAVRGALPLLKQTAAVDVAVATPAPPQRVNGEEVGADIALYLARHGISVEIIPEAYGADAGHALLALAAERASDWMVMGCVAHQRYPGVLLGGATCVVLNEATIPVLMSH